ARRRAADATVARLNGAFSRDRHGQRDQRLFRRLEERANRAVGIELHATDRSFEGVAAFPPRKPPEGGEVDFEEYGRARLESRRARTAAERAANDAGRRARHDALRRAGLLDG